MEINPAHKLISIIRSAPLTAFLCAGLCLYYAAAWRMNGFPDLSSAWNTEEVQIRLEGRPAIPLWLWNTSGGEMAVDREGEFNRIWLGSVGNILNYRLGNTPEWMALGEKKPRAWYFWSQDFASQNESAVEMIRRKYVPGEKLFPQQLREKGVTCITVPVPVKSEIERDRIPTDWRTRLTSGEAAYHEIVAADPDWTVDLYTAFSAFKKENPGEPLYRPLDIHWDSLGMAIAARETVKLLNRRGWKQAIPEIHPVREIADATSEIDNFFFRRLFLPPSYARSREELKWTERVYDIDSAKKSEPGRIILFGSSFSAAMNDNRSLDFSYGALLSRALGREWVSFNIPGGDFIDAMRMAASQGFKFHRGDLVIFEFPLWQIEWVWKKSRVFPEVEM